MKNSLGRWTTFNRFALVTLLALSGVHCSKSGFSTNAASSGESGSDAGPGAPVDVPAGAKFALSAIPVSIMNLGTTRTVRTNLTASGSFSGSVQIVIEKDEIEDIDLKNAIQITASPSSVNLQPGQSVEISVVINIGTLSPSFADGHFHVVANEVGVAAPAVATAVPHLDVRSEYEVFVRGGVAPENWGVSGTTDFIAHVGGLRFRYFNMDTIPHRVHSGGAIPHANNDMAPMGGTYEVVINPGAAVQSTTYCHSHEGGGQGRTFRFNRP
jgi:hypothetical protein